MKNIKSPDKDFMLTSLALMLGSQVAEELRGNYEDDLYAKYRSSGYRIKTKEELDAVIGIFTLCSKIKDATFAVLVSNTKTAMSLLELVKNSNIKIDFLGMAALAFANATKPLVYADLKSETSRELQCQLEVDITLLLKEVGAVCEF